MNFKRAKLEHLARIQWPDPTTASAFLKRVRTELDVREIFFLQTCNRREFYFYAPHLDVDAVYDRFMVLLEQELGILPPDPFYCYQGREAAFHLFKVAASLDSMVLGETEITKQIRDQFEVAKEAGHAGRRLKALVEIALRASKQVRSGTGITKNVVSMTSLIFRRVLKHMAGCDSKRVVLVGAGHFITSLAPTFLKAPEIELIFVNRSLPQKLARQYGGSALTLEQFLQDPIRFDVMISATSAPHVLFEKDWIAERGGRLLLLDAALPADIDPGVHALCGTTYLDLNDMEETLARNRAARAAEIPKTFPIFEEAWQKLEALWLECELATYNREISSHYHRAGEQALEHLIKERFSHLTEDECEHLRVWTRGLVKKLTSVPILGLKGVAREMGTPAVDAYTRTIADGAPLFRS